MATEPRTRDGAPMDMRINYRPNSGMDGRPNQYEFHQARHQQPFRLCICGQRAGKTIANVVECLYWAHKYPKSVGWIGEPDYPMVKRNLIPTFLKVLGVFNLANSVLIESFNQSDHLIQFVNGSRLWLGSMDNPEKVEGITLDYAGLDEARLIRNWDLCWTVLKARLSGTGALPPGVSPQLWITTTPPPVLSPMWTIFALESKDRIDGVKIFSWKQSDNVKLSRDYLDMQDATVRTQAQRQAFLEGTWPMAGTGTFQFDFGRHVVQDWDQVPDENYIRKVIYGVDWGYDPDPFAIAAILIDNNGRTYVVDEFYEVRFDPNRRWEAARDMIEKWGPGTFWCGKDRPEFIRQFRDHHIDARGDESKRDDGLDEIAGRFYDWGGSPRIFFWHECKNTIYEISQYNRDEDGNDHLVDSCFVAGTMVETINGPKAIETICPGELVLTRAGWRPVIRSGLTNPNAKVMAIKFSNGAELIGTPNHPIYIEGQGFVPMDTIRYGNIVQTPCSMLWTKLKKYLLKVLNLGDIQRVINSQQEITLGVTLDILKKELGFYTKRYGRTNTEKYQRDFVYITSMKIPSTIQLKTLKLWKYQNIVNYMARHENPGMVNWNTWNRLGGLQKYGMPLQRDMNGIYNTASRHIPQENPLEKNANVVVKSMRISTGQPDHDFVLINASQNCGECPELMTSSEHAPSVLRCSKRISIGHTKPVRALAVRSLPNRAEVYNLTIGGKPEYYANGILVHNCRYAIANTVKAGKAVTKYVDVPRKTPSVHKHVKHKRA